MPRTKAIFERVFSLPLMASKDYPMSSFTDFERWYRSIPFLFLPAYHHYQKKEVILEFIAVDAGISDQQTLQARSERELKSLQSFIRNVSPKWESFHQLHQWIFTQHSAYAASRLLDKNRHAQVDKETLKTY